MGWKYKKLNFKRTKLASQVDGANEFSPKQKPFLMAEVLEITTA